jgi:C-terminal processing protease CtpA/Prc
MNLRGREHAPPAARWFSRLVILVLLVPAAVAQSGVPLRAMLREAYELVKKRYYDPTYHGVDWDARFQEFDAKIRATTSVNAGLGAIAQFLDGLKDSHTYFLPPSRPFDHDYGFRMQLIGDKTFVSRVVPHSDAETKLKPGDEIVSINGFVPDRETLSTVQYILNLLAPVEMLQLQARAPGGRTRDVIVQAKITERPRRLPDSDAWAIYRSKDDPTRAEPQRVASIGDVLVWAMPSFGIDERTVDGMWDRARRHKAVILDLRGNPGGYLITLSRMLANVIDRDFKAFDTVERKGRTAEMVKTRKGDAFTGTLIVLTDSNSGSAAEVFARVIQLEKRGTVIGDRSAGGVMLARMHEGESRTVLYAFHVTEADIVMTDGHSLERVGVVPDETVLPTAADLAAKRDPVLSHAAKKLGLELDPAAAGVLFEKQKRP